MKDKIHPKYVECKVSCGCGNAFVTRATEPKLSVEVCAKCHPFFTGQQRFLDTAGRVEKFQKKYAWNAKQTVTLAEEAAKKVVAKPKRKVSEKMLHDTSMMKPTAKAELAAKAEAAAGVKPSGGARAGGRGGAGGAGGAGGPGGAGGGGGGGRGGRRGGKREAPVSTERVRVRPAGEKAAEKPAEPAPAAEAPATPAPATPAPAAPAPEQATGGESKA